MSDLKSEPCPGCGRDAAIRCSSCGMERDLPGSRRVLALAPEMKAAILAWGKGLEHMTGRPIPAGEPLQRAIEGANSVDGELLRLCVLLREIEAQR